MSHGMLRDGWRRVKFGDVVRKVNDRVNPDTAGIERYVAGEHMDTDDLTIRRWSAVGEGYLGPAFHMRFKPGHVLYGSRRTYLRKVAVADFEGITANTTFVVEPSTKDLLPEFLPLVMTTEAFHEHSIKQSKGSVNPYINFSDLTWYEFVLPPIDEQQRIVELLSAADAHVSSLERQGAAARAARSAVLSELLSAGGDDWIESALSEIAEVLMGQSPPGNTYNSEGIGIPFMQGSAEFGPHFPQPLKWCSSPAKIAEIGDVLLSVRAPVGDTNLANQRIAIGRGLAVVRARAGSLTPFLRLLLQANVVGLVSRSGTGMFHSITGANLKQFRVTVPPLEEQQRIVNIVSSMDDVTQSAEKAIFATKILRSGLLTVLLAGGEL